MTDDAGEADEALGLPAQDHVSDGSGDGSRLWTAEAGRTLVITFWGTLGANVATA
jgi:hypothetical protein